MMSDGISTEIQSAGGGGYGGWGAGSNPLLWLITLGFLGNRGGLLGGNDAAGAAGLASANEGISCLAQGQASLAAQQQTNQITSQMDATGNRIVSTVGDLATDFNSFSRDLNTVLCDGFGNVRVNQLQSDHALSTQFANCCCDLRSGQKELETAISNQTNALLVAGTSNTQRIVDTITSNKIQELESQLNQCNIQSALQAQTTAILTACGCCNGSSPVAPPTAG